MERKARDPNDRGCVVYSIGSNGDFNFELGIQVREVLELVVIIILMFSSMMSAQNIGFNVSGNNMLQIRKKSGKAFANSMSSIWEISKGKCPRS